MAQKASTRLDLIRTKLRLIASQKEELFGVINAYIEKVTAAVVSTLETEIPDLKTISEMSSELETVLVFLLELGAHVEGVPSHSTYTKPDSQTGVENQSTKTEASPSDRKDVDIARQYNTRLENMEEQLKQMETKYDIAMKQGDSRIEKIEKRVKKLETGGKQDVSRLDNMTKEVETLKNRFSKSQQQSSKLETLEEQVKILNRNYSSLQNKSEEIQHLQEASDALTSKVDTLATKDELAEVKEEVKTMTKSIGELSATTTANETSLKVEEDKMTNLEDKVSALELMIKEEVEPYKNKMGEIDSSLHGVAKQVTQITTRVSDLEGKQQQTAVGFAASLKSFTTMKEDLIIAFDDVTCNEGNHYDPQTGIFTAPRDGLYVTSVTILQKGEGELHTMVVKSSSCASKQNVCYMSTYLDESSFCGVGVVSLKSGDQLHTKVAQADEDIKISTISSFSCFKIG